MSSADETSCCLPVSVGRFPRRGYADAIGFASDCDSDCVHGACLCSSPLWRSIPALGRQASNAKPGARIRVPLKWAPPGSGKTFFVQQIVASTAAAPPVVELNLARCDESEFREGLARLASIDGPCLCLVDEIDARPDQPPAAFDRARRRGAGAGDAFERGALARSGTARTPGSGLACGAPQCTLMPRSRMILPQRSYSSRM